MTFIDDDKVDEEDSYKWIMMKECLWGTKDEVYLRQRLCDGGFLVQ